MNFMMSVSFAPNSLFTIVAGTGTGKSSWVFKFLRNLPDMFGDAVLRRSCIAMVFINPCLMKLRGST